MNLYDFIKENIILVLALGGAIISFLIVLTEKVAKRNKLKISVILAAFMFLIVSGQQIVSHIEQKNKDLQEVAYKKNKDLQEAAYRKNVKLMEIERKKIVKDIQAKVTVTKTLVEQLNDQLEGKSPAKIGVEVIQNANTDQLLPRPKESVGRWPDYAKWINDWTGKPDVSPCLFLIFKAGHNYNLNLLLLYLFTSPQTTPYLQGLSPSKKFGFPQKDFFDRFQIPVPGVKYVLFFDGKTKALVGYALSDLFTKELLVYLETGKQGVIENILNDPSMDYMVNMKKYFNSFSTNILRQKDAYTVAKEMISNKYNETAVVFENKLYIASLTNIVDLASR
ncbi:MAG: hypothetical protein QNJ58_19905 [Desulfobacterales bacterium]|nr:hypothetical protein [Desulfobacterales bacterium]